MATKTIPERKETTCDACGVLCHDGLGPGRRRMEGRLIVKRHVLDTVGDPCAFGDSEDEFCDICLIAVVKAINEAVEKLRPQQKEPPKR